MKLFKIAVKIPILRYKLQKINKNYGEMMNN